jgi:RNA methyltransferase, TrmH family
LIRGLAGRSARARAGLFVAEGRQCVREAVLAHSGGRPVVRQLIMTAEASRRDRAEVDLARSAGLQPVVCSDAVMAALTGTVTPQGMLAVCSLIDLPVPQVLDLACALPSIRLVVLARARDPGNAGTVLRAADATGAGGLLLSAASVDVHNPKCVRSTAGSLFHLPVGQGGTLPGLVSQLRDRGVCVLAADADGDQDLDDLLDDAAADPDARLNQPTAWVFGNEAQGLDDAERDLADAVVRVPRHGRAESLNLAIAASICLYASARAQTTAARRGVRPPGLSR